MSKGGFSWTELIPKLPGWITGFIAFISAVVGFVRLWQGNTGLVTIVLLAVGLGGGMLGCLYVAFKRTPPLVKGGKGTWQYPRARPWALAGLIIILVLAAGGVGYHLYQQAKPPTKIILLVADFDGPEPQKYRVTETVLARLRQALEPCNDVQVESLGRTITEREGSAVARAEGEKRKAAIVIWGWYGVTAEAVPMSVHFEVLRPPKCMPELGPEAKGAVRTMAVAELESFTLQTRLSAEMAYLSLFTVGMARYAAADWDGAIARFIDALNQTAEPVRALDQSTVYFYRGNACYFKGDYERAIADFDQAIELKPDDADAYFNRGVVYYYKGDYDHAIAEYDQAIKLKPDYPAAYNNRGLAYADKGDYERAIADFDRAIELKPDYPVAYTNRGIAYADKGDYERAIADFDRAIEFRPDDAMAHYNRGLAYYYKGDYEQAIADFDQAIKLNPNYAAACCSRGLAYYYKGDYDRAIADYDRAIQLQPDLAEAYYNRGLAYADKGKHDRAIADYDRAIQLRPDFAEAYYNRGNAYADKGEYDRAIADFDRAIELRPDDAVAYNNRGLAYYYKGDYDRAIQDYDEAIRLNPNFAPAYYNRGLAYRQKSQKKQAITDFRKVLELTDDLYWRQRAERHLQELGAR